VPFEGTSEARAAYTAKPLPAAPAYTGEAPTRPKVPFTATSTYKSDFKQHPLCPLHPPADFDPATWQPPRIPFEATSHYRETYTPKPIEPRVGGALPEYKPSGVPFQGTSETREAFKRWELPAREVGDMSLPPRPHIPFEGTSTSREAYTAKPIEPRVGGPMPEYKPSGVPFQGTSEAREAYKAWELPRRDFSSEAEWQAAMAARPRIPFEGKSTSQEAYTAKPIERPVYGAAPVGYVPAPDTRDFTSEARAAHGWKEPEPVCPAALLPPPPPSQAATWKQGHAMWDPVKKRWLHHH